MSWGALQDLCCHPVRRRATDPCTVSPALKGVSPNLRSFWVQEFPLKPSLLLEPCKRRGFIARHRLCVDALLVTKRRPPPPSVNRFSRRPLICSHLLQHIQRAARFFFKLLIWCFKRGKNLLGCLNTIDPCLGVAAEV